MGNYDSDYDPDEGYGTYDADKDLDMMYDEDIVPRRLLTSQSYSIFAARWCKKQSETLIVCEKCLILLKCYFAV